MVEPVDVSELFSRKIARKNCWNVRNGARARSKVFREDFVVKKATESMERRFRFWAQIRNIPQPEVGPYR